MLFFLGCGPKKKKTIFFPVFLSETIKLLKIKHRKRTQNYKKCEELVLTVLCVCAHLWPFALSFWLLISKNIAKTWSRSSLCLFLLLCLLGHCFLTLGLWSHLSSRGEKNWKASRDTSLGNSTTLSFLLEEKTKTKTKHGLDWVL